MGGASWQLPGFVIGELLGSGNSSEVWAARIAATGERVALKRVALTEPDALRAARTEAALLTALDHPHLVRLHAVIPTPEAAVLVLDLADGGSLADMLARRSRLAVGEVVTALAPIGAALAYAHQRGVLHGDVTPANILFTSIGLPMLGDLGVARIVGDSVAVRCTPEYIDPAVARGFVPGPSSDVFMLGAIAMRALTGSPVWRGTTPAGILADAAAGDLGHLRERLAVLPPPVVAVLEQALVAEPHLRCTAAEFALDLRHSAVPMPVELSAGRRAMTTPGTSRATAGRVSASPRAPGAHRAMARRRLGRRAVPDPDRPPFDRPGPPPATPGHEGALTHRVRASARPTLPPPPGRFRRFLDRASSAASVRRSFRLGIIALVVGAIALGGGRLWSSRPSPADAARLPTDAARLPTDAARRPPDAARQSTVAPSVSPQSSNSPSPADVLRRLDDLREQAFARRDVGLLARVYGPGPLLDEDSVRLRRLVPVGCGLVGAHTEFRNVQASSRSAGRWSIRATARLAPSTLRCTGVVRGHAAGAGPTGLRIELAQVAGQYRIAGQLPG
jgi:eukaryotic-like serine/threonine-protein kinase